MLFFVFGTSVGVADPGGGLLGGRGARDPGRGERLSRAPEGLSLDGEPYTGDLRLCVLQIASGGITTVRSPPHCTASI